MWLTHIQNRSPFGSRDIKVKHAHVQAAHSQVCKAQSSIHFHLVAHSSDNHVLMLLVFISGFTVHLGLRLLMPIGLLNSINYLCQCLCISCFTAPIEDLVAKSPVAWQVLHIAVTLLAPLEEHKEWTMYAVWNVWEILVYER